MEKCREKPNILTPPFSASCFMYVNLINPFPTLRGNVVQWLAPWIFRSDCLRLIDAITYFI